MNFKLKIQRLTKYKFISFYGQTGPNYQTIKCICVCICIYSVYVRLSFFLLISWFVQLLFTSNSSKFLFILDYTITFLIKRIKFKINCKSNDFPNVSVSFLFKDSIKSFIDLISQITVPVKVLGLFRDLIYYRLKVG